MDAASLRAELEAEWAWRLDELRFLRNQLSALATEEKKSVYRKSLVVMIYSHFEGFCKTAFSAYVKALNLEALLLRDVTSALAACCLARILGDLRNAERKSTTFHSTAPNDARLHRFARDREFLDRIEDFLQRPLVLDPDLIVDTESNLKPVVLQKILFRLGLDHALVDAWRADISQLLGRRNSVAHGDHKGGLDEKATKPLRQRCWE